MSMSGLYGAAFDRVAAKAGEHVSRVLRESDEADSLLQDLLSEPLERRRERVRTEPRLWLLKLCDRLEDASRKAWAVDPAAAVERAELAVEIAGRLDVPWYGEPLVEDAQALAWAYLGNAWRIGSDLPRAEEALARALDHHRRFEVDLLTEAEILGFQASLRNSQGRFGEALELLERALQLYREIGDGHQEGRVLILMGMVLGDSGSSQTAIRHLRDGLARIDPATEPRLLLVASHNLALCLSEGGSHQEALEALQRNRRLYLEIGDPMDLVRLRWLEGQIALRMGRLGDAELALGIARDAFLEQGIWFDAALAALDLAMVHARRGETAEVKRIAAEIVPVFRACRVHPEAIAALLLLRDATEAEVRERVAAGFLDRMADSLRCARATAPGSPPACAP
jgi:tetratricopeptide (TPR) repeat protein